ncbi:MAG: hypothetical protein C0458_05620 [Methylobacterium sp.]|nr:hypothetical protein [Methylobacterium sp.]
MVTIYYIPAASEDAARAVVSGIETGRIPALPEYLDGDLAAESFATYPRGYRAGLRLWIIDHRATHDGRITIARLVDGAGSVAAALLLVIGGAFLVGWGSMLS